MKTLLAALLFGATACTTVAPVRSPASFIVTTEPQRIWITQADGSIAEIGAPRVVGDTLFGFRGLKFQEIALSSVREVRAVQSAPGRTVAVALGFGIVAGVSYWKMYSKSSSSQSNCMGGEEDIC
jgi:hypothetical protein